MYFRERDKIKDEISGCGNGKGRGREEGINILCNIVRITQF